MMTLYYPNWASLDLSRSRIRSFFSRRLGRSVEKMFSESRIVSRTVKLMDLWLLFMAISVLGVKGRTSKDE